MHIIVQVCFSNDYYWLRFVQHCGFRSTLDSNPAKIGDSQQKTGFLQNAQHFLSVYRPKLLIFFTVFVISHYIKSIRILNQGHAPWEPLALYCTLTGLPSATQESTKICFFRFEVL
jgi:hypothetical protein